MTGTTSYASKNAAAVLEQVRAHMQILGDHNQQGYGYIRPEDATYRFTHRGYTGSKGWGFNIGSVCEALSIFDWWNDSLSLSQLKQMEKFLEKAIKLGFTGYACFKVGAAGCSHGMWAYTVETTNGYSPKEGKALYHSFVSDENYWDMMDLDGDWMGDRYPQHSYRWTLAEIMDQLEKDSQPAEQPTEEIDESAEIAESAMQEFKVYFKDGNQKIFVAAGMMELMKYLARVNHDNRMGEISRIEEV